MATDRISRIRIEGLRTFDAVELDLKGLTVLIGDNGTGKSTLLEAFELLRKVATAREYANQVVLAQHGPFNELVRVGSDRLTLAVRIEGAGDPLDYEFTLLLVGSGGAEIIHEKLVRIEQGRFVTVLARSAKQTEMLNSATGALEIVQGRPTALSLPAAAQGLRGDASAARLVTALERVEFHPPFDVRPLWQQKELQVQSGPRWPSQVKPADELERYAHGLPAALQELRNRGGEVWERFLLRVRGAIDVELTDVALPPAGGGRIDAQLKFRSGRPPLPVRLLSEGQLAYLAMVLALELGEHRSVLALDEPDIHYHPALSVNLMQYLEAAAQVHPVVVATHSDRMLDALQDPEGSVVLCERGPAGSVVLRRPNAASLARWRAEYDGRGIGSARSEGYERHVFDGGPDASSGSRP